METNNNYVTLSEHFFKQLYCTQNIDYIKNALSLNVVGISSFLNKECDYNTIIHHFEEFYKNHISFDLIEFNGHVISHSTSNCIVHGYYELHSSSIDTSLKQNYTINYEIIDSQIQITLLHTSSITEDLKSQTFIKTNLNNFIRYKANETLDICTLSLYLVQLLHYQTIDELLNHCHHHYLELVHENDRQKLLDLIHNSITTHKPHQFEYRLKTKDNQIVYVLEQGQLLFNDHIDLIIEVVISDITNIKRKEFDLMLQKEKYQMILKENSISILEYHIKEDYMIIDLQEEEREKQKRYKPYSAYITSNKTTIFDEDKPKVYNLFKNQDLTPIVIREHIRHTDKFVVKSFESTLVYNDDHEPIIVLTAAKDVTKDWIKQEALKQKAERDGLTHVYNIETGIKRIENYLAEKNEEQSYGLMILDIDYFKNINDTYGHPFGNYVLIQLAHLLEHFTQIKHDVIRMGGDEFILFFKDIQLDVFEKVCNQLHSTIQTTRFKKQHIIASIGGYFDQQILDFQQIFKVADKALYNSKTAGRNHYSIIK